jgi:hypothetical protein
MGPDIPPSDSAKSTLASLRFVISSAREAFVLGPEEISLAEFGARRSSLGPRA